MQRHDDDYDDDGDDRKATQARIKRSWVALGPDGVQKSNASQNQSCLNQRGRKLACVRGWPLASIRNYVDGMAATKPPEAL